MNPIAHLDFQGAVAVQHGHVQGILSSEEPLKIVKEGRGKRFDAALLDLSIEHLDQVLAFREAYREEYGGGR